LIDFGRWDGLSADEIHPFALLLQVAGNVMGRYERQCGMHGFEMPPHLRSAPGAEVGWGGETKAEPRRDWLWVRIARRCLRRRADPTRYMDLVGEDFGDSRYPPPPDHYLDRIDARCPVVRDRALASVRASLRSDLTSLPVMLFYHSGRTTDHDADDLAMALDHVNFSSEHVFVFCLSRRHAIHRLAARRAPQALIQYACSKDAYDEVYGAAIPAPLRAAGEALYDHVDREGD
jgi:hypothetical protein